MHTIRLRHPWQCESDRDQIVWSRKFNWPSELGPDEVVQLVVERASASAGITLNGKSLAGVADGRFDVTTLLAGHNLLAISSTAGQNTPSEQCPYEVRLEIVAG